MPRDAGALIRSLFALRKERRTGVLEVTAEGIKTSIFLMEGSTIFAEEQPNLETLGRLLVRQGIITGDQYATVLQGMADALDDDEPLRFGAVAVDLGFIDGDQLNDALVDQARWRLVRAFQRSDHEWVLDDRRERVEGAPLYDLAIEPTVLLAVRSSPDEDLRVGADAIPRALAGRTGMIPVLAGDPATIAQTFALGPSERAFVAMIDGSKSVAECLRLGSAVVDQAAILSALLITRAIKLVDRPLAADEEPPPSSRGAPAIPVVAPKVPTPAAAIPVAGVPQARAAAKTTHAARVNAELALQKGKSLYRAGKLEDALDELRRAQSLDATPEIDLYVGWTEAETKRRPLIDTQRATLQRLALAVSRADPENALAAYVIGRLAKLEGRENDSKRWIERAYRLDPKMREAERARALMSYDASADTDTIAKESDRDAKGGLLGWFRRKDK